MIQSDPKLIPKWSKNDPKHATKMIPMWSQYDPKVISTWSQCDPVMIPTWSQNDSNVIPSKLTFLGWLACRNAGKTFCKCCTSTKFEMIKRHQIASYHARKLLAIKGWSVEDPRCCLRSCRKSTGLWIPLHFFGRYWSGLLSSRNSWTDTNFGIAITL